MEYAAAAAVLFRRIEAGARVEPGPLAGCIAIEEELIPGGLVRRLYLEGKAIE